MVCLFAEPGYGEEGYDVEDVGGDGEEVGVELSVLDLWDLILGFGGGLTVLKPMLLRIWVR